MYTVLQGFVCPFFYLANINGCQSDNAPQEESLTIQVLTTVFSLFCIVLQVLTIVLQMFKSVFRCFARVFNCFCTVLQVFFLSLFFLGGGGGLP